jgi:hypothetical protein
LREGPDVPRLEPGASEKARVETLPVSAGNEANEYRHGVRESLGEGESQQTLRWERTLAERWAARGAEGESTTGATHCGSDEELMGPTETSLAERRPFAEGRLL